MKLQSIGRRLRSVAAASVYAIAISVLALVAPASTVFAEVVLPAPAVPSPTCEWYGEMHYLETYVYSNRYVTSERDVNNYWKWDAVSAPIAGESCGMLWSSKYDTYDRQKYAATCTEDPADMTENIITHYADGNGTGRFTADMTMIGGDPAKNYLKITGTGLTTNDTVHTVISSSLCGSNLTSNNQPWTPQKSNAQCDFPFYDQSNMFTDPNANVVEGTCGQHSFYDGPAEDQEFHKTFTWKFTRVNHDEIKPTITLNAPLNGGTVVLGSSVSASYACQDETALASCVGDVANGAALDTSTVGPKTFTVTATDSAGNTETAAASYTVVYQSSGFMAPIDTNAINKSKAGQTVPVKFQLLDSSGAPITDASSFVSLTSSGVSCSLGDAVDAIEEYTGNSGLQYLGDGYWQYNWKTSKAYAGQCRIMYLTLADGTSASAKFEF